MRTPRSDFDSAWKEILEAHFREALAFFFPKAHDAIDWSRPHEFLEQELRQAIRKAGRGKHTVDKLAKVWLKGGEEAWILLHVEVQSQKESTFPRRMFRCNVLLFTRHDRCVVSLGVLADPRADWRPSSFEYGMFGCRVGMEFPVVKLLDYEERWDELEQSDSIFAGVVMAQLRTHSTVRKPETRLQWKVRLMRWMLQHGYGRDAVLDLFRFFELVMVLPDEMEKDFMSETMRMEEAKRTRVITPFERIATERGHRVGRQEGRQEGLQEGILELLSDRFGSAPEPVVEKVGRIGDSATLKALLRRAASAGSLDEFQQGLPA